MSRKLLSLMLPGSVLLALVWFIIALGIVPLASTPLLQAYAIAIFATGIPLAWRFHSGRMLMALLLLAVATFGLRLWDALTLGAAFQVLALLLPANLLVLALLRDNGGGSVLLSQLFALPAEAAVLVLLALRGAQPTPLLSGSFLPSSWFSWTPLSQLSLLLFLLAVLVPALRFLHKGLPFEKGLCWAGVACLAALHARHPEVYLATAGLVLVPALVEASYRMAYHDELTTLPGRRAFNQQLAQLGECYAVAMVDVDHFKKFNDRYGHDTGDEVLRLVASRLEQVGGGGRAFRLGGEEFAILFPGKSLKETLPYLEEVRQAIQESRFMVRALERRRVPRAGSERRRPPSTRRRKSQPQGVSVTISVGAASPAADATVQQVLTVADKALYRAKDEGRNRVVSAIPSRTAARERQSTLAF